MPAFDRATMRFAARFVFILAMALTACSGFRAEDDPMVHHAERLLAEARQEAAVQKHAAMLLDDAERTLEKARTGQNEAHAQHLAYLAQRRVEIARSVTGRKVAAQRLQALARREAEEQKERTALRQTERMRAAEAKLLELQRAARAAQERQTEDPVESVQPLVGHPETPAPETPMASSQRGSAIFFLPQAGLSDLGQKLAPLVRYLQENPHSRILVEGYTGATGDKEDELARSLRVANAVKLHLAAEGVDSSRVSTLGRGATGDDDAENRQGSDRVEINLFEERGMPAVPLHMPTTSPVSSEQPASQAGR